jgi:hypothetical protein
MQKSCGGCRHWVKWKLERYPRSSDGLCEFHDVRAKSDSVCRQWKPIKFTRKKGIDKPKNV